MIPIEWAYRFCWGGLGLWTQHCVFSGAIWWRQIVILYFSIIYIWLTASTIRDVDIGEAWSQALFSLFYLAMIDLSRGSHVQHCSVTITVIVREMWRGMTLYISKRRNTINLLCYILKLYLEHCCISLCLKLSNWLWTLRCLEVCWTNNRICSVGSCIMIILYCVF